MPTIGLVPLFDEERDSIWMIPGYQDGILRAGGTPVILPLTDDARALERAAAVCDGFLLTGGQDVDPALYGAARLPECGAPCGLRDRMESFLIGRAVREDIPVFGICRGIQIVNACLGGTLVQDLPRAGKTAVCHRMSPPYSRAVHNVTLLPPLSDWIGRTELGVNSYHHQAIDVPSPLLRTVAVSEDGVIEGVMLPDRRFFLAVQWHPELFSDDAPSDRLFAAFVRAAEDCRRSRGGTREPL